MTMDEYWNASPHLVKYYREAHRHKVEERNQELWLQGLYIYNAFSVVLANAFSKKGATKHKYLDKPIELFPKAVSDDEKAILETRSKVVNVLNSFAARFTTREAAKKEVEQGNGNGGTGT